MVSLSILLLIGIQVISNFLFSPPCCHQDPRSGSLCTCGSGFKISQGRVEGERITQFFRQELTSENGPGQVALYGRGVTTRVTSRGGVACGTRCGSLRGWPGSTPSRRVGEGAPGSWHLGGSSRLGALDCRIPPSSAGETESRRGVRGEGAGGA